MLLISEQKHYVFVFQPYKGLNSMLVIDPAGCTLLEETLAGMTKHQGPTVTSLFLSEL